MNAAELLCGGFLLSAIGLIGAVIQVAKPALEETPTKPEPVGSTAETLETFRQLNGVFLVEEKWEGLGISKLPNGVYGYSWAPQAESPLYRRKGFQSFEVHLDAEGEVRLIGFVTPEDAYRLNRSKEIFDLDLYPESYQNATEIVCIPKMQIISWKAPARDQGNRLKLGLEPNRLYPQ